MCKTTQTGMRTRLRTANKYKFKVSYKKGGLRPPFFIYSSLRMM